MRGKGFAIDIVTHRRLEPGFNMVNLWLFDGQIFFRPRPQKKGTK